MNLSGKTKQQELHVIDNDFYTETSETETSEPNYLKREFASWEGGKEYPLVVTGAKVTENEKFGSYQLEMAVNAIQADGSQKNAGKLWLDLGTPVPGSKKDQELQAGDKKAKQGVGISRRTMDEFMQVAFPSYMNYTTVKVGKTTAAISTDGVELTKAQRDQLDEVRNGALARRIKAFIAGEKLETLTNVAFIYAPKTNTKKPEYVFHGFKKLEG